MEVWGLQRELLVRAACRGGGVYMTLRQPNSVFCAVKQVNGEKKQSSQPSVGLMGYSIAAGVTQEG